MPPRRIRAMLQDQIHQSGEFEMGNNPGQGLGASESPKKQQESSSATAPGGAEKPGPQSSIEKTVGDKTKAVTDTVGAAATQAKDKLKEMGGQLTGGVSELSGQVKEKAQQWASEAGDAMSHAKDAAQEWVTDAAHQTEQAAKDLGHEITRFIKRYPAQVLIGGFVLGFLVAKASNSSKH
jgi:gas vesicle protein